MTAMLTEIRKALQRVAQDGDDDGYADGILLGDDVGFNDGVLVGFTVDNDDEVDEASTEGSNDG